MPGTRTPLSRADIVAQISRILAAGIIVRVGTHVLALRETGATIDDGSETYATVMEGGLFERFSTREGDRTLWLRVAESGSRETVQRVTHDVDQDGMLMTSVGLAAFAGLTRDAAVYDAMRRGTPLANPPAHIIG